MRGNDRHQNRRAKDQRDHEGRKDHLSERFTGLSEGQKIVGERREDDKDTTHGKERQREGLKDQKKGKDAQADDPEFDPERQAARHASRPLAHVRTACP